MVGASLRNNEALSCGSLHKKVESENQFQLIHTNKEGYQLYYLQISVGLRSYVRVLVLYGISVLPLVFEYYCNNSGGLITLALPKLTLVLKRLKEETFLTSRLKVFRSLRADGKKS